MSTVEDAQAVPPAADAEAEWGEPRPRRRRLLRLALGGAILAVGAGAWLWVSNPSTETVPAAAGPVATATVERGTVTATESFDGTLGHGTPFTVTSGGEGSGEESVAEGSGGSTITRLAEQGEAVERGDELYRVNEQPVTLLRGVVPMYRDLGPGASGVDVKQLEKNLAQLGYGGLTVDAEYTSSTAEAVRAWQADVGAEPTGVVSRADVVFLPERGQVDTLHVSVGDTLSPGAPIVDITGTGQVASLEVDVDDRDRFEVGTKATVLLPSGDKAPGTVSSTAVVQAATEETVDGAVGGAPPADPIVQVEVALNEKAPEEFVGGPIDVIAEVDKRTDVLFVPVNALLALAEGGFGLEVVADDGTTSIVPVETGLFSEGRVEVSGARITEGTVVGVAGR